MIDFLSLIPHPLILFFTDQHVQIVLSALYVVTLASKFVPAFRVLGALSQGGIFVLTVFQHYLKTHPTGQQIAQTSNVDEKIDNHINTYSGMEAASEFRG